MRGAWLRLGAAVSQALERGRPVVALESTLIAHGLPAPRNLEVARAMERAIREAGAVPATVAVLSGRLYVGLEEEQLQRLGERGRDVPKVSTRDLPAALAGGGDGATTVASTMLAAAAAGIRLFATGGIGGVHRGASLDVSADLLELSRSPVAVVCSGAKSILDLPRTLEALEALSVPVVGFGTDDFPAFYAARSGLRVPHRCDSVEEVARLLSLRWRLPAAGGVLVAHPIPATAALEAGPLEEAVEAAVGEARAQGIAGPELTPFLLERLAAATGGRSVEANAALAEANAALAGRIAGALQALETRR